MDYDGIRLRLESERHRLEQVRETIDDELPEAESHTGNHPDGSSLGQHQADLGTETFEREKDLSILEQVEAELADVERATRRLDAGEYGKCEMCGRPIPEDRLEAMPAARLCLADQVERERLARAGPLPE